MEAQAAEAKSVVNGLIRDVWNGHDPDAIEAWHTQDFVNHTAPEGSDPGMEGLKASIGMFLSAFPDARIEVHEQLAEGDRAASYITFRGRHEGDLMGVAPSGREVEMLGLRIDRVRGGKVSDHWASFDLAGLMRQIS